MEIRTLSHRFHVNFNINFKLCFLFIITIVQHESVSCQEDTKLLGLYEKNQAVIYKCCDYVREDLKYHYETENGGKEEENWKNLCLEIQKENVTENFTDNDNFWSIPSKNSASSREINVTYKNIRYDYHFYFLRNNIKS